MVMVVKTMLFMVITMVVKLLLVEILEVIVLIFVNCMILIMVKIIMIIRDDDCIDDFDKHDSDNPVDQCDCFDHNNAYL